MRYRPRILLPALAALCTVAVAGCDRIQTAIIERTAARTLSGDRTDLLADGKLHVVLCGTGTPLADPNRAGPCTAVMAGGHFVLVDVGPGSWGEIAAERLPRANLSAVLLTHFHSDHIGDLGEVVVQSWIAGRPAPLAVYGPPGVERVVNGAGEMYSFDAQYRTAHHGIEAMPPAAGTAVAKTVALPAPDDAVLVFEADGLRVTAFAVDHAPVAPAYGYRFEYGGRAVVVSGDTRKSERVIRHARGADLLVHEALAAHMIKPVTEYARSHGLTRWAKLSADIVDYHTTPVEAAEVAKAAGVRMLALTHLVPPLTNFVARRMFLEGTAAAWDGEIVLGVDGMHFELAPGTETISVTALK